MQIIETLADELAQDVLAAIEETGNDKLADQISEVIGASSQTMQEAFLTAVRVRRAEARARALLAELSEGGQDGAATPGTRRTP
jgi:hypothetical protein